MKKTDIQWAHSTVNPVMGCDGCELWPGKGVIVTEMEKMIQKATGATVGSPPATNIRKIVARVVGRRAGSKIYSDRKIIADRLAVHFKLSQRICDDLVDIVRGKMICYAGLMGTMRKDHKGHAGQFEKPEHFPGRMAVAANWGSPSVDERTAKPWLLNAPRLIFVSDMGDALSRKITFKFLKQEIIDVVASGNGRQHIWLWLTKRPKRMAQFGQWLLEKGIAWPDNLVAMTTVTSPKTAYRIDQLRQVPSKFKGLSLEPVFAPLNLNLAEIDWVIMGGGSDTLAKPFEVNWVLQMNQQCQQVGSAFFLKQLGRNPVFNGTSFNLAHSHGGDWSQWPNPAWRIRQIPPAFLPKTTLTQIQMWGHQTIPGAAPARKTP